MPKYKLWSLLASLDSSKRKDFFKFIHYDQPQRLDLCVNLLNAINQHLDDGKLTSKESILEEVDMDQKQFRYVSSYILKSLERYFAIIQMESQPIKSQLLLLEYYQDHQIDRELVKLANTLIAELEKKPHRSVDYYQDMSEIYKALYIYRSQLARRGDMKLYEWRNSYYQYISIEIIRQKVLQQAYNVYNEPADIQLSQQIDSTIPTLPKEMASHIYLLISAILDDTDTSAHQYQELKTSLGEHYQIFPEYESKSILLLIINYCIRQINQGQRTYLNECLYWYEWGLEKGVLLDRGELSKFTYKNMISLAIKSENLTEALRILDTYKSKVSSNEREAVYQFNHGKILFHQNQYTAAMRILQQMTPPSIMDNLDAKRMLLRMYYEEEDFDILDSHLASFGAFLHRHKELGYHRTHFLNLVKFMGQIIRTNNPERLADIKMKINNNDKIADKNWLLKVLS